MFTSNTFLRKECLNQYVKDSYRLDLVKTIIVYLHN